MRVLVLSDSHNNEWVIKKIIDRHFDINTVLFLGDGAKELLKIFSEYPQKNFVTVCGNNDSAFLGLNYQELVTINGIRVLLTHGHLFNVRFGTEKLFELAKKNNYNVVLYGHTHIAKTEYSNGIYCINPGSVSRSRNGANSYAVVDILPNGVSANILKV